MPEDLRLAIPHVIDLIKAFNIDVIGLPGFEADDVLQQIGSLNKYSEHPLAEAIVKFIGKEYFFF